MATIPKSSGNSFRLIFMLSWATWGTLYAIVAHKFDVLLNMAIWDSCITNVLIVLGFMATANVFKYYLPQKEKLFNVVFVCAALTAVIVLLDYFTLSLIFKNNDGYLDFLRKSVPVRIAIVAIMLGWRAILIILFNTIKEHQEKEDRKAEIEKLAKDAELFKLRQQLQPHFLFNSLNSINALIGMKPQQARKMIEQLSDFLRGTLKKEEQQWTTLSEEMDYLQLYLEIEKVRFGYRLQTVTVYDESLGKLQLPPMILQPIVENAIKFGLYDTTGEVTISIIAKENETGYLEVAVQNPYDPETAQPRRGTGFGLSSVQRRLYLLFARNDLVNTVSEDSLFTATIKIPQPAKTEGATS